LGELHASFDPKIPELSRDGEIRRELKHLSTGRKRKQKVIPLIAASEKGTGQAESFLGNKIGDVVKCTPYLMSQTLLERKALEGDSPVD